MRSSSICFAGILISLVSWPSLAQTNTSPTDPLRMGSALLIGESKYEDKSWSQLHDIPLKLQALESEFKLHFSHVEVANNLDTNSLRLKISNFLASAHDDETGRLLIYYTGHGFTKIDKTRNANIGYITSTETPYVTNSDDAADDAIRLSVSMDEIRAGLKTSPARSVIFIFDSCFSGSFFSTMASKKSERLLDEPEVTRLLSKKARTVITAGDQGEEVPANSPIPATIIQALRPGGADTYGQGVISSKSLGVYLFKEMQKRRDLGLTPQEGSLLDPSFHEGTFLFRVAEPIGKSYPPPLLDSNRDAAKTGSATDKVSIGDSLIKLSNTKSNKEEGFKYLQSAADQGSATAIYYLATSYQFGRGVAVNKRKAADLYEAAANQNFPPALTALGRFYAYGEGGKVQDPRKAVAYFKRAADLGDVAGQGQLSEYLYYGWGGLKSDFKASVRLAQIAAEKGDAVAQNTLGYAYLNGRGGLDSDKEEACSNFIKSAYQGFGSGGANLAACYENGWGRFPVDLNKALYWYNFGAARGSDWARQQEQRLRVQMQQ